MGPIPAAVADGGAGARSAHIAAVLQGCALMPVTGLSPLPLPLGSDVIGLAEHDRAGGCNRSTCTWSTSGIRDWYSRDPDIVRAAGERHP